jgi:hypothetical protein
MRDRDSSTLLSGLWGEALMARDVRDAMVSRLRPRADIRVHVPSRDRFGRVLPLRVLSERVESLLLGLATGTTNLTGEGVWQAETGPIVREPVIIVQSYINPRASHRAKRGLVDGLFQLAADAKQEALAVVINGRMFLLPGNLSLSRKAKRTGENQ